MTSYIKVVAYARKEYELDGISRVAFSLFGLDIYWYAVIIVVGMVLGCTVAGILLKRRGENPELMFDLAVWMLPLAVIGARAYYVIFEWDATWTFSRIFAFRDGGLAIYGGVIVGTIVAVVFAKKRKFTKTQILCLLDCLVVGVILGQALGRWGNFFNQEAHGVLIETLSHQFFPMGVLINGSWYYATFFYESMANFVGCALLFFLCWKFKESRGFVTCGYFIWYGITRTIVEGMRTDSLYFLKDTIGEVIRVSQVLSIFMVVGASVCLYLLWKNGFWHAGKVEEVVLAEEKEELEVEKTEA